MFFIRYGMVLVLSGLFMAGGADDLTVSILTFKNSDSTSSKNRYLDKSITEMVTVDLAGVRGITVIERSAMEAVLREQAMALSGAVDESSAPEIGNLIGAKYLVFGTYTVRRRRIDVSYKITEVETGAIRDGGTVSGKVRWFMKFKNKLAGEIYRSLRSVLAGLGPFTAAPDDEGVSVEEVVTYGKALDLGDRQEYASARSILEKFTSGSVRLSYAQRSLRQLEKRMEMYQNEHRKLLDRSSRGPVTYNKFLSIAMGYFGGGDFTKCIEFCRSTRDNPPEIPEGTGISMREMCDFYIVSSYARLSEWDSTLLYGEQFLKDYQGSMYFNGVKSSVNEAIAGLEKGGGDLQQAHAEIDAMIKESALLNGVEAQRTYFQIAAKLFNGKQWGRALDWYKKIEPKLLLHEVAPDVIAYQIFMCYYYLHNRKEARSVLDFTRSQYPGSQYLDPMRQLVDMIPE